MEQKFTVAVMPGDDPAVVKRCLSSSVAPNTNACIEALKSSDVHQVIRVLQGIDAQLLPTGGPMNFNANSTIMRRLFDGTVDLILGPFYMTFERINAGVLYSSAIGNDQYAMLHRSSQANADLSFNTRILTDALPSNIAWLILAFFLVVLIIYVCQRIVQENPSTMKTCGTYVWDFGREMIPGANTASFCQNGLKRPSFVFVVKSATILSMFYQLFYVALLSQSLMIQTAADLEKQPFDVLNSLSISQTVLFRMKGPYYEKVLQSDDPLSRAIRQNSIGNVPIVGGTVESLVNDVENNGHVWMAPRTQILQRASEFTDDECRELQVTSWSTFDLSWSAIPLSPNITATKREYITALANSRTNFDTDLADTLPFSRVCREQLFPRIDIRMQYHAIELATISGIFWVWIMCLVFAIMSLIVEIVGYRQTEDVVEVQCCKERQHVWTFRVNNKQQQRLLNDSLTFARWKIASEQ